MKTVLKQDLKEFCKQALVLQGVSEKKADITAEVLSSTDEMGCFSHGTKNLRMYIEKMKAGALDPKAIPEVIREGPAFAIMDAKNSLGMVSSYKAMKKAIKIAKRSGVGFVAVKNSCHFGAAGYYANMALEEGMIGIAMSNTDPNVAVPGGKTMVIGNSPLAYAAPAKNHDPVTLDIAMSATAALKINQAKADNKPIPDTWLVDPEGVPTTDAGYYQNGGALQPMAAHKGYGLSVLVDILTGMLSGGAVSKDIPSWCFDLEKENRASHSFLVFNIDAMRQKRDYDTEMDDYIDNIKNSPKAKGSERIMMPGEIEWTKKAKVQKSGIELTDDVVASLEQLEKSTGLKINWN